MWQKREEEQELPKQTRYLLESDDCVRIVEHQKRGKSSSSPPIAVERAKQRNESSHLN